MLTPTQARDLLLGKFPKSKIDGYVEWDNQYVMDVQPENGEFVLDSTFSVDKVTGKVSEFSPLLLPDVDKFFDTAKLISFDEV